LVFRPEFSWEYLSKDEIAARSIKAVRNHIKHVKEVSPYYRELLNAVDPLDIHSFEDIAKLPLTDRSTLAERLDAFHGVSSRQIIETVVTRGATAAPLPFAMSQGDLDRVAYNCALSFNSLGITADDTAQLFISMDRSLMSGMAFYRGLAALGVNISRIGVMPFDTQRHFLERLKPSVLAGMPSFLKKFGRKLKDNGFNEISSSVKKIICIGQSLRSESLELNSAARAIESLFNAAVYEAYGVTELSVLYSECIERNGKHSQPELIYTEIVDEKGTPVPEGTIGELVGTPLGVEGVPLLRYRSGDITYKMPGACNCGRNSERIGPILGRKTGMINLKERSLYPFVITNALDELDTVEDYVLIIERSQSQPDQIELHVVTHPTKTTGITGHLRNCAQLIIPVLVSNSVTINSIRGKKGKNVKIIERKIR